MMKRSTRQLWTRVAAVGAVVTASLIAGAGSAVAAPLSDEESSNGAVEYKKVLVDQSLPMWGSVTIPEFRCPATAPYLDPRIPAPSGRISPYGITVEEPGGIAVAIGLVQTYYRGSLPSGWPGNWANSSATNYNWAFAHLKVTAHCTSAP